MQPVDYRLSDAGKPSGSVEENIVTPVREKCTVCVCGGGVAGIAAALAAARNGADVLLIEREFALGGLATLGLITYYLPLCDGLGHQVIFGIGEELLRLAVKHGREGKQYNPWLDGGSDEEKAKERFRVGYNGQLFMLEAEKLLRHNGVRILYGTQICAAKTQCKRITYLIAENKSGRFAIDCDRVIDATGDADVAKFAGAETVNFSQGNVLAGWYYSFGGGKRTLNIVGPSDVPDEEKAKGETREYLSDERFSGIDGSELSHMIELSHEATYNDWLRRREQTPDLVPDMICGIPQIRMTRRIAGFETPDTKDDRRHFEDCVGVTGHWRHRGPVYEIPFGALCSKNIENLLAAGRNISVTDAMWDNTRVIPTCAVTGEAAGTAAAMFSYNRLDKFDIAKLQRRLRENGVRTSVSELGL